MRRLFYLILLLAIIGCTKVDKKQSETPPPADTPKEEPTVQAEEKVELAWFSGSLEDAIALADSTGKQVVLDFYTDT